MKIFSWLRNIRNGNHEDMNKPNPESMHYDRKHEYSCKEELCDWPNGLLAIGTFGNNKSEKVLSNTVDATAEDHEAENIEELVDCLSENKGRGRKDIAKKSSLSFLIKKTFLCRRGFGPQTMFRPDHKLDHSRSMDKILRAMLHKKIYPQRPTPKKCLDMAEIDGYEEEHEEGNHESKWVKTDSEYIVLEI